MPDVLASCAGAFFRCGSGVYRRPQARYDELMREERKGYVRGVTAETAVHQFGLELNYLVEGHDSNGKLAILHYTSFPGHEPPPHVHEDEDEVFYVLEGELDAYCGSETLEVKAGQCLVLPYGKPHAWKIRSPVFRSLIVTHPARIDRIFREMQEPYRKIEASGESYEQALQGDAGREILEIAARHGMRALSPDEIRQQMPGFPLGEP